MTFSLDVRVNGRNLPQFYHHSKTWIEGRKGSEFTLFLRNNSHHRRKAVISVDGLNILTGDKNWERGYVLDPWDYIEVPGWRKDASNVAAFEFSSVKNSYNAHNASGDIRNVGVIGAMGFDEIVEVTVRPTYGYENYWMPTGFNGLATTSLNTGYTPSLAAAQCSAGLGQNMLRSSVQPQANLGTGWGDNKTFNTQNVSYNFHSHESTKTLIYYDDRSGLIRRGVITAPTAYNPPEPNPFPGYRDGCPSPINRA